MPSQDGAPARDLPVRRRFTWTTIVGVVLSLAWSAWLVRGWRVAVLGQQWHLLLDDALVSMRYAHNLMLGHGLVWNPGERVEGFSNPLWVLLMALTHVVELPLPLKALPMQIVGALCIAGCAWQSMRLVRALGGGGWFAELLAAVACTTAVAFNFFSLLGMEVAGLALLCAWALARIAEGRPVGWGFAVVLGLGTWLRVDAAWLMTALAVAAVATNRDGAGAMLWRCGLVIGAAVALQVLARMAYYGELWPNTYALKMLGYPVHRRVLRGAVVFGRWLVDTGWPVVTLALAACLLVGRRALPPLAIMVALAAYSVWVGGDAWEVFGGPNRYLLPALPSLLALAAVGVARLADRLARRFAGRGELAVSLALGLVLVVGQNASRFFDAPGWQVQLGLQPPKQLVLQSRILDPGLCVRKTMGPDAVLAVTWAGTLPYYAGGPFVDMLGKSDARIASLPMHREDDHGQWDHFLPGHLKWDYAWSIGKLAPDAVLQIHLHPEQAEAVLKANYQWQPMCGFPVCVRRTARNAQGLAPLAPEAGK